MDAYRWTLYRAGNGWIAIQDRVDVPDGCGGRAYDMARVSVHPDLDSFSRFVSEAGAKTKKKK